MIKNNVIAVTVHIFTAFMMFYISMGLFGKWDTGFKIFAVVIGILISALYVFIGYKVLSCTKSRLFDFLSVTSVLLIGLLTWYMCFSVTNSSGGDRMVWIYYLIYTSPFYLMTLPIQQWLERLLMDYSTAYDLTLIVLVILPALLFWFGILLKRKEICREN